MTSIRSIITETAALRLLVTAFAASAALAPGIATAATTTVSVTSVQLSTNSAAVDGANVSTGVTVSAHLVSAQPIVVAPVFCDGLGPSAPFVRLAGPDFASWDASFVLVSGTSTDGMWLATLPVTAAWNGDWHLRAIVAERSDSCDQATFDWQPVVATDPAFSLTVNGTNAAQVAITQPPNPASWTASHVFVGGRVMLADGTPVAGKMAHMCADSECAGGSWVSATAADGTFASVAVPVGNFIYFWVDDSPRVGAPDQTSTEYVLVQSFAPVRAVHLTARPNLSRVTLGRYLDISGSVGQVPAASCNALRVQRYAAGHWHDVPATVRIGQPYQSTVGTAHVSLSDYRFHIRTTVRGNVRYRVRFPTWLDCGSSDASSWASGVSPTIIVGVR